MTPQKIYFDESGYTGNNLLHESQEFFAYASVASNDEESREFVARAIKDYRVQSGELKGSSLLRYNNGRKLVDSVIEHFEGKMKVSISSKKYALACKFFEYIFEPCLAHSNSIFYGIGFHEFIANVLYLDFRCSGANAEEIFARFEDYMRRLAVDGEHSIFPTSSNDNGAGVLRQIVEFAQLNRAAITEEIEGLKGTGTGKWILDLSNTCLFTLLANWGTEFPTLTAVCDHSKSLLDQQDVFNAMIGREGEQVFSEAFNKRHPITFNLSGPIQFVDSKQTHGVQIADVVAAAFVYALSKGDDRFAKKWRSLMPSMACYGSILPDFDLVDLNDPQAARNAILLDELCGRSRGGRSLTEGISDFLKNVTIHLATQTMVEQGAPSNGGQRPSLNSGFPSPPWMS